MNSIRQRKEVETDAKRDNRLPPGQSVTLKFPVLHVGTVPPVDLSIWDLKLFGLVEKPVTFSWQELSQLPRTTVTMDIHCVTRWSKLDTVWEGVSLKTLIDEGFVPLKPEANYVIQHCEQNYTTNLPLDVMLQDNVLLATHYAGEPLSPDHGYPLRVIMGSFADRSESTTQYIWKGGKWLRGLEFRATDKLGFWEDIGYHNNADPWLEERFA